MSGSSEIGVTGESPFRITPDARFFYRGRSADACFESLLLGVQERQGTMLLVGEAGSGKTTLLLNLQGELERTGCLVVYPRRPMLSFDELTSACCEAAGIDKQEIHRIDRVRAFTDLLVGQAEDGKTTAIFIDDAHTVSDDFLIDLSRLTKIEKGGKALLQVVLAGQPELVGRLTASKLTFVQESAIAYRSLEPLATKEVEEYVTYRLTRAGYRGPKLSAKAVGYVARISRGIPQIVNQICGMSLQMAELEDANLVGLDLVESVALDLMSDQDGPLKFEDLDLEEAAEEEASLTADQPPVEPEPSQDDRDSGTAPSLTAEAETLPELVETDDRALQEAWLEKAFAKEVLGDEGIEFLDRTKRQALASDTEQRVDEAERVPSRPEAEAGGIAIDWEALEAGLADRHHVATAARLRERQPEEVVPIDNDPPRVPAPAPKQADRPANSAPQRRFSVAAMFLVGLLFGGLGVGVLWTVGKQQLGPVASPDSGLIASSESGPASAVPESSGQAEASPAEVEIADSSPPETEILVEDAGEAEERALAQAIAPAAVEASPLQVSNGPETEAEDPATNGTAAGEIQALDDSASSAVQTAQPADPAEVEALAEEVVPQPPAAAVAQTNDPAEPLEESERLKIPLPPIPKPAIVAKANPQAATPAAAEGAATQGDPEPTGPEVQVAAAPSTTSSNGSSALGQEAQNPEPAIIESEPGESRTGETPANVAPASVSTVPESKQGIETAALPARSNGAQPDEAENAGGSAGGRSVGAPTSLLPSIAVINRLESALPDLVSGQEQVDRQQAASLLPEADNGTDGGPGPTVPLVQTAEAPPASLETPDAADLSQPTSLLPQRSRSNGQIAALTDRSEPQDQTVGADAGQSAKSRLEAPPPAEVEQPPLPAAASPAAVSTAGTSSAAIDTAESSPAQPALPTAEGQIYMLQLASLASRPDAERELDRLIENHKDLLAGYDLTIAQGDVQGRSFFRVRSAGFGDSDLAYETCAQLVVRGQGCMVMRGDYLSQIAGSDTEGEPGQDLQAQDIQTQDIQTNVKVAGALGATAAAEGGAASTSAAFAPQGDMAVLDFLLTRDVEAREPVDNTDRFAAADREGYAYARIKNLGSPTKVEFLWRREDTLVSRYRTKIGTSGRWRTWSSTELWPGEWSVALVKEGGEVLAETRFVVE